jgi:large subunit ribosomal protein L13
MKTVTVNPSTILVKWYIIDAQDIVLGRLASKAAGLIMGKHKTAWAPNQDLGDHVIIINADKVALTGKKRETIRYFNQVQATRPGFPIRHAVKGMLPHTILGKHMSAKLHIYDGAKHPHEAQQPEVVSLKTA